MTGVEMKQLNEWLDSQGFYEVMQTYRHSNDLRGEAVPAFEAVKSAIREQADAALTALGEQVKGAEGLYETNRDLIDQLAAVQQNLKDMIWERDTLLEEKAAVQRERDQYKAMAQDRFQCTCDIDSDNCIVAFAASHAGMVNDKLRADRDRLAAEVARLRNKYERVMIENYDLHNRLGDQ